MFEIKLKANKADIDIYGELTEFEVKDWWSGEKAERYLSQHEIFKQLDGLKEAQEITLHINSAGGSAFAGLALNARLRQMAAHKTAIVEGAAMSAATLVMLAADDIKAPAGAVVMIHDPMAALNGLYSLGDLNGIHSALATLKEGVLNVYAEKTGRDRAELSEMMSKETWMTGKEAVEMGFATELLFESVQMRLSADRAHLMVNKTAFSTAGFHNMPKISSTVDAVEAEAARVIEECRREIGRF
jgi:ATP-dependent protease ClpP protease subunit